MVHSKNLKVRKKSSKKPVSFEWGEEQQKSFETIHDKLTNPPILAYTDYKLPFKVQTDVSFDGLGTVLYQTQDGKDRVITYVNRSLKPSEKNYPAHKLEFLALKWAVYEKFLDYLYGTSFEVITDNNPFTYVFTTANLDATGLGWVASLSGYNFTVKYRSRKKNADADGLSRHLEAETVEHTMIPEIWKAVALSASIMVKNCPIIESLVVSDPPIAEPLVQDGISEQLLQPHCLSSRDCRKAQLANPILKTS